jgi:pimeloyl-ACP methyl ester carboxylesterase
VPPDDSSPAEPPQVVQREIRLHGHRNTYRTVEPRREQDAGTGEDLPVLLLVHGIAGNARQWDGVIARLAGTARVVAPDLLGHGQSAKPRGDYSLGAYAVGLRDLLLGLELPRATVVGHSLGGGVAMQFAYAYPELTERLVLMSSGGLGKEVHGLLKAVTWPGAEWVLPLLTDRRVQGLGARVGRGVTRVGSRWDLQPGPDVAEMLRSFGSLSDPRARRAFVHTIRAVIDAGGQRVSARDRLYLAELIPSLVVWGRRDPIIPVAHGEHAVSVMPGARLEILDGVGHFPQLERPDAVADVLADFLAATAPARLDLSGADLAVLRRKLLEGPAG